MISKQEKQLYLVAKQINEAANPNDELCRQIGKAD